MVEFFLTVILLPSLYFSLIVDIWLLLAVKASAAVLMLPLSNFFFGNLTFSEILGYILNFLSLGGKTIFLLSYLESKHSI